ncbi:GAF domain-containing sensor histidine kinase [Paenarthrobacter nitroguajacolicus]|uniref:GAF domain-containing sensor histidine kinase n=1 Tax=Paenarthrobacter nitroguajacolicus TaxID=211146 RepID=UPI0015B966F5|nr:GAF domain-containing sensor histidine kinase [Paenarthrobacter nitroguajacolicus]NWL11017.1 histidine kinase [Paenarthrobacter nitroguajacolicus]NWL31857.1 histidine kinase [Paenarthrobacter nitroguajacolicus]
MTEVQGQLSFTDDISRDLELQEYGLDPAVDSTLLPNAAVMSALQNLVRLATELCGAPFGVVNIISAEYQHQIGAWGVDPGVCSREDSMCAKVFLSRERTVVADASQDPRFADNPFVTGEIGNVRFYASVPLQTESGFVPGTLCVFSDKTNELSPEQLSMLEVLAKQVVELLELQHRTVQLDRTYAELRHSNAKLAAFAGRVSHDLRIPLTTILGYVELVEDDPDVEPNSTAARYLDRIGSSGRRMLGMLEDVLSYSRVGGAIQPAQVSLREVTEEVARDLGIENDGVVEVQDLRLHADRGQLRTLLQNLLSNAMNYRSPDRDLRVRISGVSNYHGATIFVADNGKGIKPEDRSKALEPLVRLRRQGDGPGSGLGLATCSSIAKAHGGDLTLAETPDGGTTVTVSFPAGL